MGIAPLLQLRRMVRERSSREVSIGYFTILLIGFVLWIAYGAAARLPALVIPNVVAFLVEATVIIVAIRLRRQPPGSQPAGCGPEIQPDPGRQFTRAARSPGAVRRRFWPCRRSRRLGRRRS
jgi:MtN3 and saliva related transmembrane protein